MQNEFCSLRARSYPRLPNSLVPFPGKGGRHLARAHARLWLPCLRSSRCRTCLRCHRRLKPSSPHPRRHCPRLCGLPDPLNNSRNRGAPQADALPNVPRARWKDARRYGRDLDHHRPRPRKGHGPRPCEERGAHGPASASAADAASPPMPQACRAACPSNMPKPPGGGSRQRCHRGASRGRQEIHLPAAKMPKPPGCRKLPQLAKPAIPGMPALPCLERRRCRPWPKSGLARKTKMPVLTKVTGPFRTADLVTASPEAPRPRTRHVSGPCVYKVTGLALSAITPAGPPSPQISLLKKQFDHRMFSDMLKALWNSSNRARGELYGYSRTRHSDSR